MEAELLTFLQRYLGETGAGDNAVNAGQCVGLIELWLDVQHLPHVYGNAVDLLHNAPATAYEVIVNTPSNAPLAGDVVCWGASWGGGFGHTAVVLAANPTMLVVFEQNDPEGAGCLVGTHDYSGVVGWLRRK